MRCIQRVWHGFVASVAMALAAASAQAQVVNVSIDGLTDLGALGDLGVTAAAFGVPESSFSLAAMPFHVSLSYDVARLDENSDPRIGRFLNPLLSMNIDFAGGSFAAPIVMSDIQVTKLGGFQPTDDYMNFFFSSFGTLDVLGRSVDILIVGDIYSAEGDFGNPNVLGPPPLTLFPTTTYFQRSSISMRIGGWRFPIPGFPDAAPYDNPNSGGFSGPISSVALTPLAAIPEPETYALLLAGLPLLAFEARRRRKLQRATA